QHGLTDREYVFCDTPPDQLKRVMEEMRAGRYEGFSVTIPHKQAVMPFLDELTDRAKKVGAVNTIIKRDGKVIGDNTDYLGFEKSLEEAQVLTQKGQALVLGSGGAAQAVVAVLLDHGFEVSVATRDPEKARREEDRAVLYSSYEDLDPEKDWNLIVNTTPLGMHPNLDQSALTDPSWFRSDRTYVDIIYNPRLTKFLQLAKEAGGKIISGDRMFLWQAVEQARYFCDGKEPPVEVMEKTLF
ncbi:MAG: shikimate dehydrogenase, partial [bacterium]|nr:shikimate dehydrogenase [bacterium]